MAEWLMSTMSTNFNGNPLIHNLLENSFGCNQPLKISLIKKIQCSHDLHGSPPDITTSLTRCINMLSLHFSWRPLEISNVENYHFLWAHISSKFPTLVVVSKHKRLEDLTLETLSPCSFLHATMPYPFHCHLYSSIDITVPPRFNTCNLFLVVANHHDKVEKTNK